MSELKSIFAFFSVMLIISACSGQTDSGSAPVLSADRMSFDLAEHHEVALKVDFGGRDVTASSVIRVDDEELEGGIFVPECGGIYTFVAEYDGKFSEPLEISVWHSAPEVESAFEKHVCVVEFTGAWCINCPDGYNKMMGMLSTPSMNRNKDRIHFLAFHSDAEGLDTLAIPGTQDIKKLFPKTQEFPAYVVDLRPSTSGLLTGEGLSQFLDAVSDALDAIHPVYCGVAVSSAIIDGGRRAAVTVKVKSEYTNPFSVVLAVVQNRIAGYQMTTMFPQGQDDYVHNHVVRQIVTSYRNTFAGEKITEDGYIRAGEEAVKSFEVEIDDRWVLEDTMVYALVLDCNGCVNNMNLCDMAGGDSEFAVK